MIEINSKPEPYINSVCPLVKPNKNETLQSLLLRKRIAKYDKLVAKAIIDFRGKKK